MSGNEKPLTIPELWSGESTVTRYRQLLTQGYSELESLTRAVAQKYGTHDYWTYKDQERAATGWWPRYRAVCASLCFDLQAQCLLVAGVNNGTDIAHFQHAQVLGVDPCVEALAAAAERFPRHAFFHARAENLKEGSHVLTGEKLDVADGSVDGYLCLRTIDVLCVQPDLLLTEMQRVLKPKAGFLFSVTCGYFQDGCLVPGAIFDGDHTSNTSFERLMGALTQAGLSCQVEEHPLEPLFYGHIP